jgi:hypothetical protein
VDKIKQDLIEMGLVGVDLIGLTQDRDNCRAVVNAVPNIRVP